MTRKYFDSDNTAHQTVFSLEHLAHTPLADRVDDLVWPEIELRATGFELLGLPAVDAALFD